MPKQDCAKCKFRQLVWNEYHCTHNDVYETARAYEFEKNKKIKKKPSFIGFTLPKHSLRWCPLKYLNKYSQNKEN